MNPKMRIKLLDEDGIPISDRLVDQAIEVAAGPRDNNKGGVSLEFTARDQKELSGIMTYLLQLSGELPLGKKLKPTQSKVNPYKEIYRDASKLESIEAVISYLDGLDFRFVTLDYLKELESIGKIKLPKENEFALYKYKTFMARLHRRAKDPSNDRYDWMILFGIDYYKRKNGITVFKNFKQKAFWGVEWENADAFNIKKKKKPTRFPSYMSIDDRKKWRYMDRKIQDNKELGSRDADFYNRYKTEIKTLNKG